MPRAMRSTAWDCAAPRTLNTSSARTATSPFAAEGTTWRLWPAISPVGRSLALRRRRLLAEYQAEAVGVLDRELDAAVVLRVQVLDDAHAAEQSVVERVDSGHADVDVPVAVGA